MSKMRDSILKKITSSKTKISYNILECKCDDSKYHKPIEKSLLETFVEEFEAIGGICHVCADKQSITDTIGRLISENKWQHIWDVRKQKSDLADEECEVGISYCEYIVARTGSIIMSSKGNGGRKINFFPPTHVIIAKESQLVSFLSDAYIQIRDKYKDDMPSFITTITGASRTADIEKTLVMGAHGPKSIYLFIEKS